MLKADLLIYVHVHEEKVKDASCNLNCKHNITLLNHKIKILFTGVAHRPDSWLRSHIFNQSPRLIVMVKRGKICLVGYPGHHLL